jgi:hypothetical protein
MTRTPPTPAALLLAGALFLPTLASAAAAGTPAAARIQKREVRQEQRIRRGVRKGQLTRREARNLRLHQAHLRRMERRSAHDGVITRAEQKRIAQAQNRQSRRIARLRHNAARQPRR